MSSYAAVSDIRAYLEQVPDTAEQLITVSGATGGSLTLTYDVAAATVAWNATASAVQTALAALQPLAALAQPNDPIVTVRGRRGGPWRVRFSPRLGDDAELLLANGAGLSGTAPAVTVRPYYDGLLQACLTRATEIIDELLGFSFAGYTEPETRTVRSYGGGYLWLPPHQPGSVTAVAWAGYPIAGWALFNPDLLWPMGYLHGIGWASGGGYAVTARWGYGDPPESIVQICLELAVNIWRGKDRGMFTEVIGAEGGGAIRYTGGVNKSQQAILNAVRDRLTEIPI